MAKSGGRKIDTTNQHAREKNTEEVQVHNSNEAKNQNAATRAEHRTQGRQSAKED